uniref:V-set pre-B cell surrogate light chain 1 n=1 Tax=Homo sapiens TaxID=9606 RepID=F8W8C9_HUMAN
MSWAPVLLMLFVYCTAGAASAAGHVLGPWNHNPPHLHPEERP